MADLAPAPYRGTSDDVAALRARASTTPTQRWEWVEASLRLASDLGLLQAERAARQARADAWPDARASESPTR